MSNPTLEEMARVYETRILAKGPFSPTEPMREALLWLADNVSDEMANAWTKCDLEPGKATHGVISAALRAAAGGDASPPKENT